MSKTKSFDEKENTVTITGTFDPEKFMKKIIRKVGKFILSYEVNEINVKKEEKAAPKKEKPAKGEKDPASAPAEDKKKAKNDDKDDKKKGDDKALDPAPEKSAEKPAPKPAAAAAVIETPVATELYAVPAIGAPASWVYYGQYPYGYYSKACHGVHERPPCSCGSGYGQNHYGQQGESVSELESTCRVM